MIDFTRDWIAQREQLEDAATEGPWHWEPPSGDEWPRYDESLVTKDGDAVLCGWGYDASGIEGEPADREFIADARTSLPAALAALKAVLAVHQGLPCYGEPGDDACPHDSEYEGDRHFESADGWILCEDAAGDGLHCSECTHADDDELTDWPCPTLRAIEDALRGES